MTFPQVLKQNFVAEKSKMKFPQMLESTWHMGNSDINIVGEYLGYAWNEVNDAVGDAAFYAEEGDGSFIVERTDDNDYSYNEIINKIMIAIFENYPKVDEIRINN